jgi:mannosyltransferase OCH1-like enzyme
MIPKIIHYCWFGPNEKSEISRHCIESWKQFCPDFEFKEWTEENTHDYQNKFYKDAYRKKKYAFVADCVRVQALNEYGGIYLDLDMLLIQSIESLLALEFFTGYEVEGRAAYGLFGGVANHRFFELMKQFYATTPFNQFSLPVITHTFKPFVQTESLLENEQILSPEYFYALPYEKRDANYEDFISSKSLAVHLWDHSWSATRVVSTSVLWKNLRTVLSDFIFHGYPKSYAKRYVKEFSRKLYHRMVGKKAS